MISKVYFFLFVLISIQFCATTQTTDSVRPEKEKSLDKTQLIDNLRLTYPPHQALTASFKLRGMQNGKKFFLTGKLNTGIDKQHRIVSIKLYDAVFSSLVYSLDIDEVDVKTFDHMKRESQTIALEEFYLVEIFGSYFPFKLLLPFLYGSVPEIIFFTNTKIDTKEGYIDFNGKSYHLRTRIVNNTVEELEYKDFYSGTITHILFQGKLKNTNDYYFPKAIQVTNSQSEEYVSIEFTGVKFLENE